MAALTECDFFFFPSEFLAERYVDWGLPAQKCCVVIPNGQVQISGSGSTAPGHSPPRQPLRLFRPVHRQQGHRRRARGADRSWRATKRVPAGGIVLEINGGNRHYASRRLSGARSPRRSRRSAGDRRSPDPRCASRGAYSRERARRPDGGGGLGDRALDLVGGVRARRLGSLDVRPPGHRLGDIGGARRAGQNGVNGYTFPPRNAVALAEMIKSLVGNVAEWQRAHAAIRPDWSHLGMFDRLMEIVGRPAKVRSVG